MERNDCPSVRINNPYSDYIRYKNMEGTVVKESSQLYGWRILLNDESGITITLYSGEFEEIQASIQTGYNRCKCGSITKNATCCECNL